MNISNITDMTPHTLDIALILISGIAILYCAILSRRLHEANDLKAGAGTSIITLSQAIESTHKAAQEAQTSTLQTVETLRHLLAKSETATPKIEALISELEQARDNATVHHRQLNNVVEMTLTPAIDAAQTTASGLLKIVSDINHYKESLPTIEAPMEKSEENKSEDNKLVKLSTMKRNTL